MYNSKVGPEARVYVTHLPWVSHFVCAGATPRKCIRVRTLVLACVMSCAKSFIDDINLFQIIHDFINITHLKFQ